MTKTLIYEDYETDHFDQAEYPISGSEFTSRTIAGISPFTVPDAVQAEINEKGMCRFVFSYPDSEPSSRQPWQWLNDSDVAVRVGAHSKRILELYVRNATERLASGPLALDPRAAWAWCREEPSRVRNTAIRNTEVIARIMITIPDALRRAILDALRTV